MADKSDVIMSYAGRLEIYNANIGIWNACGIPKRAYNHHSRSISNKPKVLKSISSAVAERPCNVPYY